MSDFRINVIIDPANASSGGKRVKRELHGVGQAADRTRTLIARAFAFAGVSVGIQQLVGLVDTFTNIQNRLRTVTDGTAELAVVTDELFAIANRTRSSYEATAETYARVGLAAKELGVSQKTLIDFTESLNQAVILSGASAQEAQAGLIQLSQGLASGALRGDELNSVLEQLPVVADVIAKSLGVTRGKLRELGSEGKITADIVLNAFAEAREELLERFGKAVPTIGQSIVVLRNNFIRMVGAIDQGNGISAALSSTLLALAENLDTVARVALTAGLALGVNFAVRGVGAAASAVKIFTLAIAANPIGAIVIAVTIAVSALVAFSDQLIVGGGHIASLQDVGIATFEAITGAVGAFTQFFSANFGFIAEVARSVFSDVEVSISGVLRVAARTVDGIVGFFKGLGPALLIVLRDVPSSIEALFVGAFNAIAQTFSFLINGIIRGTNKLRGLLGAGLLDEIGVLQIKGTSRAEDLGRRVSQAIADGIEGQGSAEAALDGILVRADQIARDRVERQRLAEHQTDTARSGLDQAGQGATEVGSDAVSAFGTLIGQLREEGDLLRLSNRERGFRDVLLSAEKELNRDLTMAEKELLEAQTMSNIAIEEERRLLEDIQGPAQEYITQLEALNRILEKGSISSLEFADAQRDLRIAVLDTQTDFVSGFERGILNVSRDLGDFASMAERSITGAFRGAEDALTKFVTTGKLDFNSLANSIITDLARMAIQAAIVRPAANFISSIFGFADGGLVTTGTPVQAAVGGLISGPGGPTDDRVPALLSNGEFVINAAATRMFMPLLEAINSGQAARAIRTPPSSPSRSNRGVNDGGSGTIVQVFDQRSGPDSAPVETQSTTGADGKQILRVMIRDTVKREAENGLFDGTLRNRYGVRPTTIRR